MKKRSVLLLSGGIDSTVVGYMLKKAGALYRVLYVKHGKRRNERELLHTRRLVRMLGVPLDIGDPSPSRHTAGYRFDQDDGPEDMELPVERVIDGDATPDDQLNSENGQSPFSIMLTIGLYYTHTVEADELHIGLVKQQTLKRPRFKEYLAELARIDHVLNPDIPPVVIAAPLIAMTRGQIIALGADLGVDFTTTWSCLRSGELHCGTCAHCVQRKAGFNEVGIADPTKYEACFSAPARGTDPGPPALGRTSPMGAGGLNSLTSSSRHERDAAWAEQLAAKGETLSAVELLALTEKTFGADATIATSFGVEDIVLLHLAREHAPSLSAFMLDTGRLPPETFEVAEAVRRQLGIEIRVYAPERSAVEELVSLRGLFSFRDSMEARHACCELRKLEPLRRALRDRRAWVTGVRREQSVTRTAVRRVEWDSANHLVKINPLAGWTRNDVWAHVREHSLPYNRLHDLGYPSIGCAPCTRAVRPYEDERAGRWWWESSDSRECGLHRR